MINQYANLSEIDFTPYSLDKQFDLKKAIYEVEKIRSSDPQSEQNSTNSFSASYLNWNPLLADAARSLYFNSTASTNKTEIKQLLSPIGFAIDKFYSFEMQFEVQEDKFNGGPGFDYT